MNIYESSNSDECIPECLPFEESLNKSLKDAQGKTSEELEKQCDGEDEVTKEKAEEYLEYIENLRYNARDFENDDEYSSGEAIPDCNPWRE